MDFAEHLRKSDVLKNAAAAAEKDFGIAILYI